MSGKKSMRKADTVFFVPADEIAERGFVLSGDDFRHAIRVLRQEEGSEIEVVDGEGRRYLATIEKIESRSALCKISSSEASSDSSPAIILAVGTMNSRDRFETLIEKAQELGARAVWELSAEHSSGRSGRRDRLMRIAIAAMKQSRRARLVRLEGPVSVAEFAETDSSELKFVASMSSGAKPFVEAMERGKVGGGISILVGPEGGFSDAEESALVSHGYIPVSLGESRLRTETAAIAALSIATQFAR